MGERKDGARDGDIVSMRVSPSRAPLVRPVLSCVHISSKAPATQGNTVVGSLQRQVGR